MGNQLHESHQVRKGDALLRSCILETLIVPETWYEYNEQRSVRIPKLLTAFKSGNYRAPNIRRVYIPKGDGKQRPLGLPTVEDKLLQTAVTKVLSPVYETMFYNASYGFRPCKSQHQALECLFKEVSFEGKRYIIDADMKNYFGSIEHQRLREFLDLRIKDGVIRKMNKQNVCYYTGLIAGVASEFGIGTGITN